MPVTLGGINLILRLHSNTTKVGEARPDETNQTRREAKRVLALGSRSNYPEGGVSRASATSKRDEIVMNPALEKG